MALAVRRAGAGEEPLEGEAFRSAIMDLVPRSTRDSGSGPRLLVFEDLHWCDDASMDLVIETAKLVEDLPFLLVFAFRPDERATSAVIHTGETGNDDSPAPSGDCFDCLARVDR